MLRQGSEHDGARVRVEALAVCPARLTTRHSVVAPGKSWSNFVVVSTLLVDSKVGIVDYWSAKEWREFCHPSRANEAPPAGGDKQGLIDTHPSWNILRCLIRPNEGACHGTITSPCVHFRSPRCGPPGDAEHRHPRPGADCSIER